MLGGVVCLEVRREVLKVGGFKSTPPHYPYLQAYPKSGSQVFAAGIDKIFIAGVGGQEGGGGGVGVMV